MKKISVKQKQVLNDAVIGAYRNGWNGKFGKASNGNHPFISNRVSYSTSYALLEAKLIKGSKDRKYALTPEAVKVAKDYYHLINGTTFDADLKKLKAAESRERKEHKEKEAKFKKSVSGIKIPKEVWVKTATGRGRWIKKHVTPKYGETYTLNSDGLIQFIKDIQNA